MTSHTSEVLAPGNILINKYLLERAQNWEHARRFIELGAGRGQLSSLLLEKGLDGIAYDLNEGACRENIASNTDFINDGRFEVRNSSFLDGSLPEDSADIVITSMMLEHLTEDAVAATTEAAASALRTGGRFVVIVPAGPQYWGVEDDVAGHLRRYTREDLGEICAGTNLRLTHMAGLTFPVSNVLLPLSNLIVTKVESRRVADQSVQQRTIRSGNREIPLKTSFPRLLKPLLSYRTFAPLHYLQKRFVGSERALVLYAEFA